MKENDSDHRLDDDSPSRPEHGETQTQQAPVIRMLANPRRVRRA